MDKIQAMQVFVRVAETNSFTAAADSLGLPKGSVSRQIQALEKNTGTRLLQRTTRRVSLTRDGERYYHRCLELLGMLEDMDTLFRQEPSTLDGTVRVDMSVAMATEFVLPRLPELLQRYPGLHVELSSSDSQADLIRDGLDCVVRVGELADSGMMVRHIGYHRMINCVSPGYVARLGLPLSPDRLSQHVMVHYAQYLGKTPSGFEYYDGKKSHYFPVPGTLTVNSTETYRAACVAGLGIIQVPARSVATLLAQGLLQEVLEEYPAKPMPVSLLYPYRRNVPPRVRVFMDWLSGVLQEYTGAAPGYSGQGSE